jgi:hypothetical protein
MENDPNNPYGDGDAGNTTDTSDLPDDFSWYEFVGGIWRRMTDASPYTGESS